jgi:putative DNA primase/helicase
MPIDSFLSAVRQASTQRRMTSDRSIVGLNSGYTEPLPNSSMGVEERASPRSLALDPKAPMDIARAFLQDRFTYRGSPILFFQAGVFYTWTGTHYRVVENDVVRSHIYQFMDLAKEKRIDDTVIPFRPNRRRAADVMEALTALTTLPVEVRPPTWLDARCAVFPPEQIVACANGLLHVPTRTLLAHTPIFFSQNALDFCYEVGTSSDAIEWLSFLRAIWPDDREAIEILQEIFGYLLTSDTRQQKMFLITGPKRSGKGTIARILRELVGPANAIGPTLAGLSTNFGLAPLIGKTLSIISDARLSGRADHHIIAERLLAISGEDALTIDRKFLPAWNGQLRTRFLILSNELPRLPDASGAFSSRFIVLTMKRSFYGREDLGLLDRLKAELPGIFKWSLEGLERLNTRGYFHQPSSSIQVIEEFEDLSSPISAFVRERCYLDVHAKVKTSDLFNAWKNWCDANGREHPGTTQSFGRDLRSVIAGLTVTQNREGEDRARFYEGIKLRSPLD